MRKGENEYEGRLTADQMRQSKSTKGETQGRIAWLAILSVIFADVKAGSSKVLHAIASVFFSCFCQRKFINCLLMMPDHCAALEYIPSTAVWTQRLARIFYLQVNSRVRIPQ